MSITTEPLRNVVGGERVESFGTERDQVLNPATEEVIAEMPRGTAEDVERAVAAAAQAAPAWGRTTPAERAAALLELADRIDAAAEELTLLEARNAGKPLAAAGEELPLCSDHLRFFAGAARVLEGKAAGEYVEGYTSMVRREPVGVVARSRRGTTRWPWRSGRSARRWPPATRSWSSCSTTPTSRPSSRACGWARSSTPARTARRPRA
jgi:hypothetical protein